MLKFDNYRLSSNKDRPNTNMTNYVSISQEELHNWMKSVDGGHFPDKQDMLDYFDVLVSVAGLVFWRTTKDDHTYFKSRNDGKVTVTAVDTSGQRLTSFVTWCTVSIDWLEANIAMSNTPNFNSMDFRDQVKGFIV